MATGTIQAGPNIVVEVRSTTIDIPASAAATKTLSVTKTGYTPIGIVGVELHNNRSYIYRYYISNSIANIQVQNTTATAYAGGALYFYILYLIVLIFLINL